MNNKELKFQSGEELVSVTDINGVIVYVNEEFYPELVTLSRSLDNAKSAYDSLSRHVFSGCGAASIVDFTSKMNEGRVKTILGRVIDSTKMLADGVLSLKYSSGVAQSGAEQQAQELAQVAAAMEEMSTTIKEVANNTANTSDWVESAHKDCELASDTMTSIMTGVSQVAKDVDESSDTAIALAEKAKHISSVIQEIQGIADQTNLLALNAAIEAARARNLVLKVYDEVSSIAQLAEQISVASKQQGMVATQISRNITKINDEAGSNLEQANRVNQESQKIEHRIDALNAMAFTFSK